MLSFLFPTAESTGTEPRAHRFPRCYCYPVSCWLLTILHLPVQEKHPALSVLSTRPRSFPAFLMPHFPFSHLPVSCNPLTSSGLIVMCKIRCKMPFCRAFSQSVEVLLPGNCHRFGSDKLTKILTGLDVSCIDKTTQRMWQFWGNQSCQRSLDGLFYQQPGWPRYLQTVRLKKING